MNTALTNPLSHKPEENYTQAIEDCLHQMDRIRQEMGKEQSEINVLKAETRAMLDAMRTGKA